MAKYNLSESVNWQDVLDGVQFRLRWFYVHFTGEYEAFKDELDRKRPNMDKVKLWARFAFSYCRETMYWLAVYQSVRRFIGRKEMVPKFIDIKLCHRFMDEEYEKIDPASYLELAGSNDARPDGTQK